VTLERHDAATVTDLEPSEVAQMAEELWIIPPARSMV